MQICHSEKLGTSAWSFGSRLCLSAYHIHLYYEQFNKDLNARNLSPKILVFNNLEIINDFSGDRRDPLRHRLLRQRDRINRRQIRPGGRPQSSRVEWQTSPYIRQQGRRRRLRHSRSNKLSCFSVTHEVLNGFSSLFPPHLGYRSFPGAGPVSQRFLQGRFDPRPLRDRRRYGLAEDDDQSRGTEGGEENLKS